MPPSPDPPPPGAEGGEKIHQAARGQREILMKGTGGNDEESPAQASAVNEPTAFQFLLVNEPLRPPNRSHRHAVRTHVMRNFHSKKKKEKPKSVKNSSKKQGASEVAPGKIGSPDPKHITNQSLFSSQEEQAGGEGSSILKSYKGKATCLPNIDPSSNIPQSSPSPPNFLAHFDRWLFNTTSPYILLQSDGAPNLCLDARRWPFPQTLGGSGPKVSVWMPQMFEPPPNLQMRACMHKSVQVLPYLQNCPEYFEFKVETIKWINGRLTKPGCVSDTTIGSILLLISYEASRGNVVECLKHMDGLEQIVNLRGGMSGFDKRNTQFKMALLDMIVAIMGDCPPRFQRLRLPRPISPPPPVAGSLLERIYDSPLHSSGTLVHALADSDFDPETINVLQRMRDLTIFVSKGLNINTSTDDLPLSTNLEDDGLPSVVGRHQANNTIYPSPPTLHRIIQLTSSIYIRALSNPPIPFTSRINRKSAHELCFAIESPVNDETWDRFPGILVWILLTVTAAGKDMPEHSLLASLIVRVGLGSAYGWWEEFSEGMTTFMKVKRRAERR